MRSLGRGIEIHPSHGDWIRRRESGFMVEALYELYPRRRGNPLYYEIATAQWASRCRLKTLWTRATNQLWAR
jgi:hypothetical protein